MRIKRVVIQGFKTFARRTEFLFDPGVTAVVGPNGSGKSNIVDAVRWCLGEQSFSLLRSKKTSDVIFAGSDKRARLNTAEVSLTLDNSAGDIPIDFAEVEITRRAYRDGDNEYLVNGQRVRLQDIVDLLAQTGLGKRTYSVVGQGLIDRALSMAPEERRALFEEAAGITGYQINRDTAVRRLDATHQNLMRVQDLVAELSPRLVTLRRQAARAREREQIARDLQALLRDWYGFRWHATLTSLKEHHAAVEVLGRAVTSRLAELANVGGAVEQTRSRQGRLRARLGELHYEASQFHRQAEQVGRTLAVAQERLRQLQARQEESRRELPPLEAQQATLTSRQQELTAAVQSAQADLALRQRAVEEIQAAVGQRQQERNRLLAATEQARRMQQRTQAQQADVRSRVAQTEERRTTVTAERTQLQSKLAAAEEEVTQAAAALTALEAQAAAADQAAAALRSALTGFEQTVAELGGQLGTADELRRAADRSVDRLQTRLDLLNRLRSEGAGYGAGVRSVLQASGTGELPGLIGTVASQLRVPKNLDKAIETALGGALQNVIAESWSEATRAIDYLKQRRAGRATFLPLDRLHLLPAIPAPARAGILGNAVDLVDFDARMDAAMQQLLNRVWVAEDLDAGRAALDRLGQGPRPTVVTLDGEIIRPGGAVTGGQESNRGDDALLARERELRELPGELAEAIQKAQRSAADSQAITARIEQARVAAEDQQRLLADQARQERALRQQIEEARRGVDRARQAQRWHGERVTQVSAEADGLEERLLRLTGEVAGAESAVHAALAAVAQLETELAAVSGDELLQELANRRSAAAEVQGHLRSQQALLDNAARTLQAVTAQLDDRRRRIAALDAELVELVGQVASQVHEEQGLSREIGALQSVIQPLETELAGAEAGQVELETAERALQQHLRREESALSAAQLHLQRSEDGLHQLRSEIEQDLGLVELEQSDDLAYQPPLPWEAFVQQLPVLESLPDALDEEVREMRGRLARLSGVNPDAPREYDEAASRHEFLTTQAHDLEAAAADLRKIIRELDMWMETELRRTIEAVGREFAHFFHQLFNGGTAHLELTDPEHIATSGIEIIARPPGKRPQSLALLSGGERSLAACALIFAILRVSPTPFCVLDEVDAALDEANVDRFRATLEDLSRETQFIVVTHNRRTLEGANTIYGVTMGNDGVSRVISLRLAGDRIVKHDEVVAEETVAEGGDGADLKAIEEEIQM